MSPNIVFVFRQPQHINRLQLASQHEESTLMQAPADYNPCSEKQGINVNALHLYFNLIKKLTIIFFFFSSKKKTLKKKFFSFKLFLNFYIDSTPHARLKL